jgi:hypothetical protein
MVGQRIINECNYVCKAIYLFFKISALKTETTKCFAGVS